MDNRTLLAFSLGIAIGVALGYWITAPRVSCVERTVDLEAQVDRLIEDLEEVRGDCGG